MYPISAKKVCGTFKDETNDKEPKLISYFSNCFYVSIYNVKKMFFNIHKIRAGEARNGDDEFCASFNVVLDNCINNRNEQEQPAA